MININLVPSESRKKTTGVLSSLESGIPHEIIFRKKKGFTFPFAVWIKNSPKRFRGLLFKGEAVDNLYSDFQKGNCHWSKVWSLAVIQAFDLKSAHE